MVALPVRPNVAHTGGYLLLGVPREDFVHSLAGRGFEHGVASIMIASGATPVWSAFKFTQLAASQQQDAAAVHYLSSREKKVHWHGMHGQIPYLGLTTPPQAVPSPSHRTRIMPSSRARGPSEPTPGSQAPSFKFKFSLMALILT